MLQQLRLHRRNLYWVGGISALIALLAVWTFAIEWEWTMNGDDAGFVQSSRTALAEGGIWGLINTAFASAASEPTTIGRFRPMYLLYSHFAYLLSPDLMRGLRLLSVVLVVVSLIRLVPGNLPRKLRLWSIAWLLALTMANYMLFFGLQFPSYQELTGITLIAIGLLSRNYWWQSGWFVLAALTKEPFVPLLVFFAFYLLHRRKYVAASLLIGISGALASVVLLTSPDGTYTGFAFQLNPWHLFANLEWLGHAGISFLVIMIVGLIALRNDLYFNGRSLTFIGAGIGYGMVLLFWWVHPHYTAPMWYLITVGLALSISPRAIKATADEVNQMRNETKDWRVVGIALSICVVGSAVLLAETFRTEILGWNTMHVEARDWVLNSLPGDKSYYLYVPNPNAWEFDFFLREEDPSWPQIPSPYWRAGEPRPEIVADADYVIVLGEPIVDDEVKRCPAIRVWTKGFIAPTKC